MSGNDFHFYFGGSVFIFLPFSSNKRCSRTTQFGHRAWTSNLRHNHSHPISPPPDNFKQQILNLFLGGNCSSTHINFSWEHLIVYNLISSFRLHGTMHRSDKVVLARQEKLLSQKFVHGREMKLMSELFESLHDLIRLLIMFDVHVGLSLPSLHRKFDIDQFWKAIPGNFRQSSGKVIEIIEKLNKAEEIVNIYFDSLPRLHIFDWKSRLLVPDTMFSILIPFDVISVPPRSTEVFAQKSQENLNFCQVFFCIFYNWVKFISIPSTLNII